RFLGGSSEWNEEESKDLIELRKRLNEFQLLELHQRGDDKDSLSITEVKAVLLENNPPKKFLDYIDYQGNSFPVFAIWVGKEDLCRNSIGRYVQSF
ncbi:hypothetical protein Goklo_019240, partial [Gossypium klotzschianum]|nr:hypothetical protein [Gossypium klotzschianum]